MVPTVGGHRELISARLADPSDDLPSVEPGEHKLFGQVLEQLWVARRIASADVIEWLDHASAGQVAPDAVGIAEREVIVLR